MENSNPGTRTPLGFLQGSRPAGPTMRRPTQKPFLLSLSASTGVHVAALTALLGYWGYSQVRAEGKSEVVLVTEAERPAPEAPPTYEEEQDQPLEEEALVVEPEIESYLPDPEPLDDEQFEALLKEVTPRVDVSLVRKKPEPAVEEPKPEKPVTPPEVEATPPPAAHQELAGDPEPVDDTLPVPTHNPAPNYPRRAVERRIEGAVMLALTIDAAGTVIDAKVTESSGSSLLDKAALAAVKAWRFAPGTKDGKPEEMELPWRLLFSLEA